MPLADDIYSIQYTSWQVQKLYGLYAILYRVLLVYIIYLPPCNNQAQSPGW